MWRLFTNGRYAFCINLLCVKLRRIYIYTSQALSVVQFNAAKTHPAWTYVYTHIYICIYIFFYMICATKATMHQASDDLYQFRTHGRQSFVSITRCVVASRIAQSSLVGFVAWSSLILHLHVALFYEWTLCF